MITVPARCNYQLKLGNIRVIFPNFQNRACCGNHFKVNKHNSHRLAQKFVRIVVHGHYQFLEARSFPRDAPAETRSLLETDHVQGQK